MKKMVMPVLSGLLIILLLPACVKKDIILKTKGSELSETVSDFLKGKIATGTHYQAAKIELLLKNLNLQSCRILKIGTTESIICNLKTYQNTGNKQFPYTYYKASFLLKNGKLLYAYIYTISTSFKQEELDADIANILTYKNCEFSGEIITNSIDGQLLFFSSIYNGRLQKTKQLRTMPTRSPDHGRTSSQNCVDYYWVTINYFSDGTITQSWEYLFTTCEGCGAAGSPSNIEMICPPNGGGFGDQGNSIAENVTIQTEETDTGADSTNVYAGGIYERVKYIHTAIITYASAGIPEYVDIQNTNASPLLSPFIDSYGISGSRLLTLFGHYNYYQLLTPPYVMINWSCIVNGRYAAVDGRIWTRQWNHYYSAIH